LGAEEKGLSFGDTLFGLGDVGYRLAGLLLVAFVLGLTVAWILGRRASERLKEEMEELKWRLANLERHVYERLTVDWEGPSKAREDPGDLPPAERPDPGQGSSTDRLASLEGATHEETQALLLTEAGEGMGPPSPSRRRVRVTKVLGMGKGEMKYHVFEGMEEAPPEAGRPYRVRTDGEVTIRTTPVLQVTPPYFQTRNSVYKIEALEPEVPSV